MNTRDSGPDKLDILKEDALANIEKLLRLWKIDYTKVNDLEYDFLSPSRIDNNFGAVRFNIEKGLGADFANTGFSDENFKNFGEGFDRTDFGFSANRNVSFGFDIIGLAQRVHNSKSYKQAARDLEADIRVIRDDKDFIRADLDAHIKRTAKALEASKVRIDYAKRVAKYCYSFIDTLGQTYLKSRGLDISHNEPVIKFHAKVMCKDVKKALPALIFMIQNEPNGEIQGIHRIYLKEDGSGKADVPEPKKALGIVKGNAIWFGKPDKKLYIVEGPENALTLLHCGAKFVACAINAANMPMLTIPKGVEFIVICPDRDPAGFKSAAQCRVAYDTYRLEVCYPTEKLLKNGKYADLNDLLIGRE